MLPLEVSSAGNALDLQLEWLLFAQNGPVRIPRADITNNGIASVLLQRCPFRKLYPTILVVQAAEDIACGDGSAALDGPMVRGVLTS